MQEKLDRQCNSSIFVTWYCCDCLAVQAAAEGILLAFDRISLEKNGSHIKLTNTLNEFY